MIKFTLDEQATTPVPTIFLKKYMCDAPADYVKVYLYGLCLANAGTQLSDVELEAELHMTASQIEKRRQICVCDAGQHHKRGRAEKTARAPL